MRTIVLFVFAVVCVAPWHSELRAQATPDTICPRPAAGSVVPEPEDLRSQHGVLRANLTIRNYREPGGATRYCYMFGDGSESPNLRLNPGDLLILHLKNDLQNFDGGSPTENHDHAHMGAGSTGTPRMGASNAAAMSHDPCSSGDMTATSTNLHFHGLTVPAVCHEDDVLNTSLNPHDPPFGYRFRIPAHQPPGLYWYHPHIHGFSKTQVLGGASGAMIIEGIERANKQLAGLPERVLIIRDQDLVNPDAQPSKSEPVVPKTLIDRDGDAANNGTGFGKPAKDLSINFVPVPYPDYSPATIKMKPGEKQLWRVLNASAITYLNLAILFNRVPQQLGLVALDGVSLNISGKPGDAIDYETHLGVPPGARVEFVMTAQPIGVTGLLVTRTVDTGPGGENDPNRAIAAIIPADDAPAPQSTLPPATKLSATKPASAKRATAKPSASRLTWLGDVAPVRTRRLYFSEEPVDPNNPIGPTKFYLTVDGETPQVFDPKSDTPNIIAKQGTVEDWIIENS